MVVLFACLMLNSVQGSSAAQKPVATPFALSNVRLLSGPFEVAHQATAKYLLLLEPARLLAGFRANSGLTPKGEIYGGWETGGLSGHSLGHYLTACSQEFARTGDVRFKAKVDAIVDGLAECQTARHDGFLMAFRFEKGFDRGRLDQIWADVAAGNLHSGGFDLNGMWSPWYVHHKVLAGLLDADALCHNRKAREVACRFADWAISETSRLTPEMWQKMLFCEYGGMNESLAELYNRTHDGRYLALSRKFYDARVLDPLAAGIDDLPGKHSNTQIPKIIGLARLYEVSGAVRDAHTAEFFWDRIVNHHSYAIGGNSNGEYLGEPDQLSNRLSSNTCETCNTYNMLKLTGHLFEWSPEADKMDFYERAYFNHILGSQDPETAGVTYFMPLGTGSHREYSDAFDSFTCCHGTGMENHTKHGDNAYYHAGKQTLWVNLFMPTELNWNEAGIRLRQETDFPVQGHVTLTVLSGSRTFEMRVRHPGWAKGAVTFRVNGAVVATSTQASTYVAIKRHWKSGDKLEFELPMLLHEQPMPDNPNRVALMRGPIVLAAVLEKTDRIPVLIAQQQPIEKWLKPVSGKSDEFIADEVARPSILHFYPFYELHHEQYGVYFDKFTPQQWAEKEAQYRAEEARVRDLESRTIDKFAIGEMQPERDHQLTSERNDVRDVNGRNFRTAMVGGWFDCVVKVDPNHANELVVTYWGNDRLRPNFDIQVNGSVIAHEELHGHPANEFFDVNYSIPERLTKSINSVKVRIQPTAGHSGPSVAGFRLVRAHP